MESWLFYYGGVCLVILLILRRKIRNYQGLPLVGHLPFFALQSRQQLLEWIYRGTEYHEGRSWRIDVPFIGKGWIIENPACLKDVLSSKHDSFGKGELASTRMKDLFGEGIILVEGHKWKAQRLAGQHAFSSNANLQSFGERILPKHLNTLLAPFERSIERDEELDVQAVAYDYAMVVFGELAYDSDFARTSAAFTAPFERASTVTQDRFTNPLYRLTERLLPSGRRFQRDVAEVKAFGERLVKSMTERIKAEEEGKVDVPGVGGSKDLDGSTIRQGLLLRELVKEHGQGDDYSFLADACLNFLTAGKDTTAQALAWTLYEILRNPAIYAELQAEIDKAPTELSVSNLTAVEGPLQYANAVISESLRLHPPVPLEIHENITSAPIVLADGTLVGPAEIVLWSPWAMGRSTRIWGQDAGDFKPSRWFPEVQSRKSDRSSTIHPLKKSAFEFPVFHAGPRSCLGKNLARIELAYALVQLVKRYDMVPTWPLNQERSVGTALTAPILGGLGVRARHRQKDIDNVMWYLVVCRN